MSNTIPLSEARKTQGFRSWFFYGPPGTGKTTAATLLPHKRKLVIDVDQKISTMDNLPPEVVAKVSVWTPNTPALSGPHIPIRRMDTKVGDKGYVPEDPQGYMRVVEFINSLIDQSKDFPYDLVILDSLSSLVEHMERLILHHHKAATMSLPLWGIYAANLQELKGGLLSLPCDRILIAHSKIIQEELTSEVIVRPLVAGQTADKLPKDFNEVYYFVGRSQGKYRVRLHADRKYVARTSKAVPGDEVTVDEMLAMFAS